MTPRDWPEPVVIAASQQHTATLIILHGLGDSGAGWRDFVPGLGKPLLKAPYIKCVLPTAPQMPVTLIGGTQINAWYDLYGLDRNTREDVHNLRLSAEYVSSLVRQEVEAGIDSKRVVVAGFSQGGALALLSLRMGLPLAGVLAISSYLTLTEERLLSDANKQTPVLMCHGTADPAVQYKDGVETCQRLRAAGANVLLRTYEGLGHALAEQELTEIKAFIHQCLPANPDQEGLQFCVWMANVPSGASR